MKSPDVIATGCNSMALLEAQTLAAAAWLSSRFDAPLQNAHDQIRVEAWEQDRIIQELRAAGFQVVKQKGW